MIKRAWRRWAPLIVAGFVALSVVISCIVASADNTKIPVDSEMYAPLVFDVTATRSATSLETSSPIPETVIVNTQTPSVRSSIAGGTFYSGDLFTLAPEQGNDYARLRFYFLDMWVWDYAPYDLDFVLDPCIIDISQYVSESPFPDTWGGFFPSFVLSTYGVNSSIVVNANITSVKPDGSARDSIRISNVIQGTSINERHEFDFSDYVPDFEAGDLIYVNEFSVHCVNYSPDYQDAYFTGFTSERFVEPIDTNNSFNTIELGSVPLVNILWNSIVDVFQIDLIPGISIGTILLAVIGLPLLIWFLKLVAGG